VEGGSLYETTGNVVDPHRRVNRKRFISQLALILANCAVALLLVEITGRLLIKPYEGWYAALFGVPLPPVSIVFERRNDKENRAAPSGIVVDGRRITLGDADGYYRYDAILGYATLENTVSVNGWWHSNEIGARETGPTPLKPAAGQSRWLLVGESFAHGTGVQTAQTWAEIADRAAADLDIVNLAVAGYSMAQAYLRYQSVADRLQHDGVLLAFAPTVDLWRDVNTIRDLGEPWGLRTVMPRFVPEGDGLRLVSSPYADADEFRRENENGLSQTLEDHLRRYDRFYFPLEHRPVAGLDRLLTYKLVVAAYGRYARGRVRREQLRSGSEGLEVSRRLFRRLQHEAAQRGKKFAVLVIPTVSDLRLFHRNSYFRETWRETVKYACGALSQCIDLASPLADVPLETIDVSVDGNHYGARMNERIAREVLAALSRPYHD
jgi:hypothetical protein